MAIYDFFLSRNNSADRNTYIGHAGRLFYDSDNGELRISDGITVGGFPIPITVASNSNTGGIIPGKGLQVTDIQGKLELRLTESFRYDQNNNLQLKPASDTVIGGIKSGPGVNVASDGTLTIDPTGLEFSFGDFYSFTATGSSNTTAAWLSSINENEDIVIASNGNGVIDVVGQLRVYPPNGPLYGRDPVFNIDLDGKTTATALNVINTGDIGLLAPLNVSINQQGLTKVPAIVTGTVAQFTGRDNNSAILVVDSYGYDSTRTTTGGEFVFRTGRGTNAIPEAIQQSDSLGVITAAGWASNGYGGVGVGGIRILANEDFTPTSRGSKLELFVIPDGTVSTKTVVTINSNGLLFSDNTTIENIETIKFDTTNLVSDSSEGSLYWNNSDGTLNLTQKNNVIQQVGQEQYAYVKNNSGSIIPNGTCVRFNGASQNGESRLAIAPFRADGIYPTLYGLGITTQSIENDQLGYVTVWGNVRNINTTGSTVGETWQIGDVLYAHPTVAGAMTNIKPTAPNNVMPIAAVLKVDEIDGEIFVRPTIEQRMAYGVFIRNTNYTPDAAYTAYTIPLTTTETSNGVSLSSPVSRITVSQSGLYQIDITAHFGSTGGQNDRDIGYLWLRKNGVDIPNTMRRCGVDGALASGITLTSTRVVSMNANDYIEVVISVSNTRAYLNSPPATEFGPSTASLEINVTQVQL